MKLNVDNKRKVVRALEKNVLEAGRQHFGVDYQLQLPSIGKGSPEEKAAKQQKSVNVQMNTLAEEKERLLHLEKLYIERIRKLKEAQQKDGKGTQVKGPGGQVVLASGTIEEDLKRIQNNEPEKIFTAEKIDLGRIADSDLDREMVTVTPKRRRSLMELKPDTNSLIPNLDGANSVSEQLFTGVKVSCLSDNATTQNRSEDQPTVILSKPAEEKKPMTDSKQKVETNLSDNENDQHYEKVFSTFSKVQMTKLKNLQVRKKKTMPS